MTSENHLFIQQNITGCLEDRFGASPPRLFGSQFFLVADRPCLFLLSLLSHHISLILTWVNWQRPHALQFAQNRFVSNIPLFPVMGQFRHGQSPSGRLQDRSWCWHCRLWWSVDVDMCVEKTPLTTFRGTFFCVQYRYPSVVSMEIPTHQRVMS